MSGARLWPLPSSHIGAKVASYNLICGHDWIHANWCVPSSLHHLLIWWVGDDVKIVHAYSSACIAKTNAYEEIDDFEELDKFEQGFT